DRAGTGIISSRLGLQSPAIEVSSGMDIFKFVEEHQKKNGQLDYLIFDEAQFYESDQIDQLARIVDILKVDVFAFGILSDFRTSLFPGSMRLVELADRVNPLQVEALCWCGVRATHNARIVGGRMTREGDQLLPGDTAPDAEVLYEVLCRKHHMANMSSKDHDKSE
ncbi:MAG: thymidine kinase, partial [Actinobacteria bacterium]|nr:thymidine kinase [Actinomycetota bacterium]